MVVILKDTCMCMNIFNFCFISRQRMLILRRIL